MVLKQDFLMSPMLVYISELIALATILLNNCKKILKAWNNGYGGIYMHDWANGISKGDLEYFFLDLEHIYFDNLFLQRTSIFIFLVAIFGCKIAIGIFLL